MPSSMRNYLKVAPPWKKEGTHDNHTGYVNFEQQLKHTGESEMDEDGEEQDPLELNETKPRPTPPSS